MAVNEDTSWLGSTFPWNSITLYQEGKEIHPMYIYDHWSFDGRFIVPVEESGTYAFIKGDNVIMLILTPSTGKIVYRRKELFNCYKGHIDKIINLDDETKV